MTQTSSRKQLRRRLLAALLLLPLLIAALLYAGLYRAGYGDGFDNSLYHDGPYRGKKALFIVPHEDDELGLAGTTIPLLAHGGAEVFLLFVTNGDYYGIGGARIAEAEAAAAALGVPADHLLFLGYGDQWTPETTHLYLEKDPDAVMTSAAGRTATYGTEAHPDFRSATDGHPSNYTKNNLFADLGDAIRFVRADYVFCSDLDFHRDHRAVSLAFEHVMGRILRETPDYRPHVYKGFVYDTAWDADNDFHRLNVKSTSAPAAEVKDDERYDTDNPVYRWADRVRFPVPPEALAYTERSSSLRKAARAYRSQMALLQLPCFVNGDQVFWERNTTSLLYGADVAVSSGEAKYLTDFILVDSPDICAEYAPAYLHCTWSPDEGDAEKRITVTFPSPVTLTAVSLYDDCALENNILSGTLAFSDGSVASVGPLYENGAETRVSFPEKANVLSFTFTVTAAKGAPGLLELEAFGKAESPAAPAFVKLIEHDGYEENFLYRYLASPGETIEVKTYAYPETDAAAVIALDAIQCSPNAEQAVTTTDGAIRIAPDAAPGSYLVRAYLADNPDVYDQVEIVVPTAFERLRLRTLMAYERAFDATLGRLFCQLAERWTYLVNQSPSRPHRYVASRAPYASNR